MALGERRRTRRQSTWTYNAPHRLSHGRPESTPLGLPRLSTALLGYDSPTAAPPFGAVDNRIGAESREVIRPDYDGHAARVTPFVPLRRD